MLFVVRYHESDQFLLMIVIHYLKAALRVYGLTNFSQGGINAQLGGLNFCQFLDSVCMCHHFLKPNKQLLCRVCVQRKALVSSFIALAVEKDADTITAKPLGGAATRSSHISTKNDYNLNLKSFNPGVFIDDMPAGHKIKMMGSTGTDLSFAEFEAAIINAIAWTKEIPPEVIKKSFSSNYAASKQANAEFSMFLDMERHQAPLIAYLLGLCHASSKPFAVILFFKTSIYSHNP
jgi:hypothetical protein